MMTFRRHISEGVWRQHPAKPVAAATIGLVMFAAVGCGGSGSSKHASATAQRCPTKGKQVTFPLLTPSPAHTIEVTTNLGSFAFSLDVKDSPCTTSSFAALTRKGFFDKTHFHRIVPGFVIQGGDPTGKGTGGPGYSVRDIPPADAAYTKGVVAMAKTGAEPAGTSGSQFFVVTGADAGLGPDYAILGKVTKGLGVVEKIGRLGDATEHPTRRVVIRRMVVTP